MDDDYDIEKSAWNPASPDEKNGALEFGAGRRLTVTEIEMGKAMDMGSSYFDANTLDVDETESVARSSIGVARTADVHVLTRTGMPRIVEYKKL
jgi:hypothetical protein